MVASKLIAVAGGIGSGKSVVCNILRIMGFQIYDCDSRAKAIMNGSREIKQEISRQISPLAVKGENGVLQIDRQILAGIVFNDPDKLKILNAIVHSAVRQDIIRWREANEPECKNKNRVDCGIVKFVESAIPVESGLHLMVDEIWEVQSPVELRIKRSMLRDKSTVADVEARIHNQRPVADLVGQIDFDVPVINLTNDNLTPLLPQVLANVRRVLATGKATQS